MNGEVSPTIPYRIYGFDKEEMQVFNHDQIMGIMGKHKDLSLIFKSSVSLLTKAGISEFTLVFVDSAKTNGAWRLNLSKNKLKIPITDINQIFWRVVFKAESVVPATNNSDVIFNVLTPILYDFMHSLSANCSQAIAGLGKPIMFENVFSGGLYRVYRSRLKAEFEPKRNEFSEILAKPKLEGNPFNDAVHRLANQVFFADLDNAGEFRQSHSILLGCLRLILELKDSQAPGVYKDQALRLAEELTCWIFDKANVKDELINAIRRYVPELNDLTTQGFTPAIQRVWFRINATPSLRGCLKVQCSDQHSAGSLIYRLWSYDHGSNHGGKSTHFLRMSNAVFIPQVVGVKITVIPEFVHFLRQIQNSGKTFLYINLMVAKGTSNEAQMSDALHELETGHGLTNATVVSVDRNSDLIRIVNNYDHESMPELKETNFYTQFLADYLRDEKKDNYCRWSPKVNQGNILKLKIKPIIDSVLIHYFNDASILEDSAREEFNELALMEIVDDLIDTHGFDYVAISCRATVDRGPSFYTLLYLKHLLKKGVKIEAIEIRDIFTMLFSNAIVIENRLPIQDRCELFLRCAQRMLAKGPMPKVRVEPLVAS